MVDVNKYIQSLGVPKLYLEGDNSEGIKELKDIEAFIKKGGNISIEYKDDVKASKIGVEFLKAAIRNNFLLVNYVTPRVISSKKIDSWEQNEDYDRIVKADLIVIKLNGAENKFEYKCIGEFLEERLLEKRSNILIGNDSKKSIPDSAYKLFKDCGVRAYRA